MLVYSQKALSEKKRETKTQRDIGHPQLQPDSRDQTLLPPLNLKEERPGCKRGHMLALF